MAVKTIKGKWIDELVHTIGQYVRLETGDGIVREGRLSGLGSRQLRWNGEPVEILTELELNGDPADRIPLQRIIDLEVL